jgi:hypothetical protein
VSVYGGIASRATERISYRALVGWTKFKYADGDSNSDGITYTVSGNWKISDTWNTMFLANSYFRLFLNRATTVQLIPPHAKLLSCDALRFLTIKMTGKHLKFIAPAIYTPCL